MACTYSIPGDLASCNMGQADYWCTHNCFRVYDTLYNNANGILGFSQEGLEAGQAAVETLFASSEERNMDNVVALCLQTTTPGICDTALTSYCANNSLQTQVDADLCGCYVPPDPTLNVPDACQPLCNLATTVRKAVDGVRTTCPANICIIDNVSVSARSSTANVNFTNICPGCRVGSDTDCICVVNSSDVNALLGTVGITTNITQFCGPQSTCSTVNADGSVTTQPCSSSVGNLQANSNEKNSYPWVFFVFLGLFLLVVFLVIVFTNKKQGNV